MSDASAYDFAEAKEIPYRCVSAKTGEGIDEVFQMVGREILEQCYATLLAGDMPRNGSHRLQAGKLKELTKVGLDDMAKTRKKNTCGC